MGLGLWLLGAVLAALVIAAIAAMEADIGKDDAPPLGAVLTELAIAASIGEEGVTNQAGQWDNPPPGGWNKKRHPLHGKTLELKGRSLRGRPFRIVDWADRVLDGHKVVPPALTLYGLRAGTDTTIPREIGPAHVWGYLTTEGKQRPAIVWAYELADWDIEPKIVGPKPGKSSGESPVYWGGGYDSITVPAPPPIPEAIPLEDDTPIEKVVSFKSSNPCAFDFFKKAASEDEKAKALEDLDAAQAGDFEIDSDSLLEPINTPPKHYNAPCADVPKFKVPPGTKVYMGGEYLGKVVDPTEDLLDLAEETASEAWDKLLSDLGTELKILDELAAALEQSGWTAAEVDAIVYRFVSRETWRRWKAAGGKS